MCWFTSYHHDLISSRPEGEGGRRQSWKQQAFSPIATRCDSPLVNSGEKLKVNLPFERDDLGDGVGGKIFWV